ncbi:MAG: riboflavin biosynthesis protein RibF [Paludibacteraceae bacterium]|nr:riboflavin biosynthesis protein RibF [Paludibacteraceae bacterium]
MRYISTIGFFDGVHLGHRYVLAELACIAKQNNLSTKVVTFAHHPRTLLNISHNESGFLLTTTEERTALLADLSDKVLILDFSCVHTLTARQFIRYLHKEEQVDILLMGYDHRFGSDMPATFTEYQRIAEDEGVSLIQLSEYNDVGHVSSTIIRNLLLNGNIAKANTLLGYEYMISGKVVQGRQIGRQIGFPTANISVDSSKLVPCDGVYGVDVIINGNDSRRGILNIGCNPTVDGQQRSLEVHIPEFNAQIYDTDIRIRLKNFIRHEIRFDSLEQLKSQIERDIEKLM